MHCATVWQSCGWWALCLLVSSSAIAQDTTIPPQVSTQLKLLEVSVSKARRQGSDLSALFGAPPLDPRHRAPLTPRPVDPHPAVQLVETLCKDNLARLCTECTLLATSGQAADFVSGAPTAPGLGTQIRVLPEVLRDGAVRIQLRVRVAGVGRPTAAGQPGVNVTELATTLTMHHGETVFLAGPSTSQRESHTSGTPIVSALPVVGALFRKTTEEINQLQTVLLVKTEIMGMAAQACTDSAPAAEPDHGAAGRDLRPVSYDAPPRLSAPLIRR